MSQIALSESEQFDGSAFDFGWGRRDAPLTEQRRYCCINVLPAALELGRQRGLGARLDRQQVKDALLKGPIINHSGAW
jgi:hypothetical protein